MDGRVVGPRRWAERGKERAELAATAVRGWLKVEETERRGCGGWFPCLASRNRYAGGSPAPPTPPTPYVIAPRRPKPLFLVVVRPTLAPRLTYRLRFPTPSRPFRLTPPSTLVSLLRERTAVRSGWNFVAEIVTGLFGGRPLNTGDVNYRVNGRGRFKARCKDLSIARLMHR